MQVYNTTTVFAGVLDTPLHIARRKRTPLPAHVFVSPYDGEPHTHRLTRSCGLSLSLRRVNKLPVSFPDAPPAARVAAAEAVLKRAMRAAIVEEGRRPDGRGIDETRDLTGEVRGVVKFRARAMTCVAVATPKRNNGCVSFISCFLGTSLHLLGIVLGLPARVAQEEGKQSLFVVCFDSQTRQRLASRPVHVTHARLLTLWGGGGPRRSDCARSHTHIHIHDPPFDFVGLFFPYPRVDILPATLRPYIYVGCCFFPPATLRPYLYPSRVLNSIP